MRPSWTTGWLALIAVAICAATLAGCSSWPKSGIDPSGEHVFTPPPGSPSPCPSPSAPIPAPTTIPSTDLRYFDDPMNRIPSDDVAVLLDPREETVVPVGSEVILVAGVVGQDGYLRTNRRLEWTVAPGGVGHFVAVQKNGFCDMMLGDFNSPRIVNSTFAVGSTSRENTRLNRGTPALEDDKFVLRGQGWVTLTSPVEGTSHVTVVAPEVYGWDARTKSVAIHFVDAVVQYPPPAINQAGTKHVFTTTVMHAANQSPCENWRVRYEIVSGPPAGFLPTMANAVEVPTNSAGQACAEIMQKQPASGVNKIAIQVVRPAGAVGPGSQRLVVGNGSTTKTWSAADLAVRVAGPNTAGVGTTIGYRIELANPGDLATKDVTAIVDIPDTLTFQGANPTAESTGRQLRWRLGDLGPRQQRAIDLTFRAEKQGAAVLCCDATAAGGLKVRNCATTTISLTATPTSPPAATTSPLDLQLTPTEINANVGEKAAIKIGIVNRTQTAVNNVKIHVQLDRGLANEHADANNAIDRTIEFLTPGETRSLDLAVDVKQPGRLAETVEISAAGVAPIKAQVWINATAAGTTPPAGQSAPITVSVTGPLGPLTVGKLADFVIVVKNTTTQPLQNITVTDRSDAPLDPVEATDGWQQDKNTGALYWNVKSLAAGDSAEFRVRCRCDSPSPKASHRVVASLPDMRRAENETSVEIRKALDETPAPNPPGNRYPTPNLPPTNNNAPPNVPTDKGLTLTAVGLANPIPPNKELTYEIRVVNNSASTTYRQVTVSATIPDGMSPVPLGTPGAKIAGQLVQFDPSAELAPGQSLTYRVRVSTNRVGNFRFHAQVTAAGLAKPVAADADETEVRN